MAIEYPARGAGLELEPGLTELLLEEGQAGALPLLQLTLRSLWDRREARRLTIRSYQDLGGLSGALVLHAEAVYATFTDTREQEICRRLFLRLVQLGEGSEDTRRRASLSELLPDDPAQAEAVRAVIRRLADSRLITTEREESVAGEDTLEIAHEGLVRGWPRLRKWIEADRVGLRTHLRLTDAAREWADAAGEAKEATLYTGTRLAVVSEWAASHRDELCALDAAFLAASESAERRRDEEKLESESRVYAVAESAADRQKQLRLRLVAATVVAGLLAAISFGLALLAMSVRNESILARKEADAVTKRALEATQLAETQEKNAKAEVRTATSRRLAALSASERNNRLDRSLLLAIEALRTENTFEARDSLYKALQVRPGLTAFLHMSEGRVTSAAFSPDGKAIAAGHGVGVSGGGVVLWDVAARKRLAEAPLLVTKGGVTSVSFSPDGNTLASASYNTTVILWDATTGKQRGEPLAGHKDVVNGVSFSSDSKTLASASSDRTVILWDATTGKQRGEPLAGHKDVVNGVSFSSDSKTLASASSDRTVILWDATTGKQRGEPLAGHKDAVNGVSFSPDGRSLASASSDRTVMLWDAATGKPHVAPLSEHKDAVMGVAYSPDGRTLASASSDRTVILWDVLTGKPQGAPLEVHMGFVMGVSYSPDGKTLAAGYRGTGSNVSAGGVVLWDMAVRKRPVDDPLPVTEGGVIGVAFSPDGKTLAAAYEGADGNDGGVVMWDLTRRQQRLAADWLRDPDLKSWESRARQIANRNFTREEWANYFPEEPYRATFPDLPVPPEDDSDGAKGVGNIPRLSLRLYFP